MHLMKKMVMKNIAIISCSSVMMMMKTQLVAVMVVMMMLFSSVKGAVEQEMTQEHLLFKSNSTAVGLLQSFQRILLLK